MAAEEDASQLSSLLDRVRRSVKMSATTIPPEDDRSKLLTAAVCMILKPADSRNSLEILLLRRRSSEGDPWSGQIAFPGGRSKPGEAPLDTVRREVVEESRINLEHSEVLGPLAEVFPGNFSIGVLPFVAVVPHDTKVKIDNNEIDDFFWIPASYFLDRNNSSIYSFSRQGRKIEVPSFVYMGKYVIWGMTLRIIENFLSSLN